MQSRILAEDTHGRHTLQAVLGDMTTTRFTAFDELTAELFADAIRALATFMPNSGI
jgi:hypothetical protein